MRKTLIPILAAFVALPASAQLSEKAIQYRMETSRQLAESWSNLEPEQLYYAARHDQLGDCHITPPKWGTESKMQVTFKLMDGDTIKSEQIIPSPASVLEFQNNAEGHAAFWKSYKQAVADRIRPIVKSGQCLEWNSRLYDKLMPESAQP